MPAGPENTSPELESSQTEGELTKGQQLGEELKDIAAESSAPAAEDSELTHNENYTQHHPNAIVDPAKAEYVAYASKTAEEDFAISRRIRDNALSRVADAINEGDENSIILESEVANAKDFAESMREKRELADANAKAMGEIYDQTNG